MPFPVLLVQCAFEPLKLLRRELGQNRFNFSNAAHYSKHIFYAQRGQRSGAHRKIFVGFSASRVFISGNNGIMSDQDNRALLQRYVHDADEDAFRELVANYIGLVESTALRRVNGDRARALDITQIVFTDLARQARRLNPKTLLGSWLYQHTCFVASKMLRTEQRRLAREKEASQMLHNDSDQTWTELAPLLDTAILELSAEDQNAIILRFFENQNLHAIGAALNVTEDAAQKRVHRALEKLRAALQSKGLSISVPSLSAILLSKATLPAAAATVGAVASAALSAAVPSTFATTLFAILMSKTTLLIAAACLTAAISVVFVQKSRTQMQMQPASALATTTPSIVQTNKAVARTTSPTAALAAKTSERPDSHVEQILKQLDEALSGTDREKIQKAIWAFWTAYDASTPEEQFQLRRAIPILIGAWKNASNDLKKNLIGTFQRFKPATEEIVGLYIETLDDQDLAHHGAAGLMFAGPVAAEATDKLVGQLKRNHRVKDTGHPGSSTARMSLEALANIGPAAAAAVSLLTEYLTDTNMLYRVIGAKAYWNITHDADAVLPVLTKALLDENSFWAAQILAEMGAAAAPALAELEKAYSSGEESAQVYAYGAIRKIDPSRGPSPNRLVELMQSKNRIVRLHAAETLWNEFRNVAQILPTLINVTSEVEYGMPKPEVEPALKLLSEIGPAAESALPAIQKLLESRTGHSGVWIAATNAWRSIVPNRPVPSIQPH